MKKYSYKLIKPYQNKYYNSNYNKPPTLKSKIKDFFYYRKKRIFIVLIILFVVLIIVFLLIFLRKHIFPPTPIPPDPRCYLNINSYGNCAGIPFDKIKINNDARCKNIPDKYPLVPVCNQIPPNLNLVLPSGFSDNNNDNNIKILNSTQVPIDIYFQNIYNSSNIINNKQVYDNNNNLTNINLINVRDNVGKVSLCPSYYILISGITDYRSEAIYIIPSGVYMENPFGVSLVEWTILPSTNGSIIDYDFSGVGGANFHGKAGFFKKPNNSLEQESIKWFFPKLESYQNENKSCYKLAYNGADHGQGYIDLNQASPIKTSDKNILAAVTGLSESNKMCKGGSSCPNAEISNLLNTSTPVFNFDFNKYKQSDVDCCLSSCPLPDERTVGGVNQHYCRKWYHNQKKKDSFYGNWLQQNINESNNNPSSKAYSWALDEWQCTDDNCGWSNQNEVNKCYNAFENLADSANRCSCLINDLCKNCNCFSNLKAGTCDTSTPKICSIDKPTKDGTECSPIISGALSQNYGCMENDKITPNYMASDVSGTILIEITYILPALYIKPN